MSLKKTLVANYLGQGWSALMGLAFVPLYISYLGIEAYGLIGLFAVLQAWLSLLDIGLTPTLNREMARFTGGAYNSQAIRDLLRSIELLSAFIALLIGVGVWAASNWLASDWLQSDQLSIETVSSALTIMGTVTALRFIENIYKSCLIGLQRQIALNIVTSAMATLRGLGVIGVLIWISPTIEAFFIWQGIVSVLSVCLLAFLVYRSFYASPNAGRFSLQVLKDVWRFASGTFTLTFLGFILSQIDKLILVTLLSLKEFGYYTLAFTAASSIRLLALPVDQAVYPRLAKLFQQRHEMALAETYHKANQLSVVLMGGFGIFLAIFGEPILQLWTQNQAVVDNTYPIMWVLTIGMIMNGLMHGPYNLQIAAGWTGLLIKVNSVMVVMFVPVIFLLTQKYQAIGAAIAWAILNLVYIVVVVRFMHKKLLPDALWEWYTKDIFLPLGSALIVGIALKAIMPSTQDAVALIPFLIIALASILLISTLTATRVRQEVQLLIKRVTQPT